MEQHNFPFYFAIIRILHWNKTISFTVNVIWCVQGVFSLALIISLCGFFVQDLFPLFFVCGIAVFWENHSIHNQMRKWRNTNFSPYFILSFSSLALRFACFEIKLFFQHFSISCYFFLRKVWIKRNTNSIRSEIMEPAVEYMHSLFHWTESQQHGMNHSSSQNE